LPLDTFIRMFLVLGCPDKFLSKLISLISLQYAVFKVQIDYRKLRYVPSTKLVLRTR